MSYRLLVLDIDGTLRPSGQDRVPRAVAEAVCAVQRSGVRVAIATGRGRCCIPKGMLRSIRPDYWLCAAGAQLLDRGQDARAEYFLSFVLSGSLGVVEQWMEDGMRQSPAQLAHLVNSFIFAGASYFLQGPNQQAQP